MPTITVDAVLFDMDGTLIDSTPGVMQAWHIFGKEYGFDAEAVAQMTHGRRLYDTLKEYCHIDDEAKLHDEVNRFEAQVIEGGPTILPGVADLIAQLKSERIDKAHAWTIVTSASNLYAPRALERCNIAIPDCGIVTSNDVSKGKPHPDPYLAGAQRCAVDPKNCLVVEDAPSGIRSGHAAGSKTLAVCTSHTRQEILDSGANPDYIVKDLSKVKARWMQGKLHIDMDETE